MTLRPDFLYLPWGRELPGTGKSGTSLPCSHTSTTKKWFCRLTSAVLNASPPPSEAHCKHPSRELLVESEKSTRTYVLISTPTIQSCCEEGREAEGRWATACVCLAQGLGGINNASQECNIPCLSPGKPTLFIEGKSLAQAEELTRHWRKVTNLSRPFRPKWLFKRLTYFLGTLTTKLCNHQLANNT